MGGAWDSTNVADGDVAVFTPVGLDHMDRLGNTISEIAETKSGIIKNGALVITSDQTDEAMQVIKRVSNEKAEGLFELGKDFSVVSHQATSTGQRVSVLAWQESMDHLRLRCLEFIKVPILQLQLQQWRLF